MARDYWRDRYLRAREALLDRGIGAAEAQLRKQYTMLSRKVIREMQDCYEKIQLEQSEGILLPSDLYRFNRYYETMNSIDRQIMALGGQVDRELGSWLSDLYEKTRDMTSRQLGFIPEISPELAARAVRSIWCDDGLTFSDRVWHSSTALKESLQKGLMDTVAAGGDAERLKTELMTKFNSTYHEASRLVRTEMSHVYNESTLDTYREAGIEHYIYLTSEDEISGKCPLCTGLNRRTFSVTETQAGVNYPPIHPNCRCTTVPADE